MPSPRKCHWTQTGTLEWGRWSLRKNGHVRIDGVDRAVPELQTVTPATSCERGTDRPSPDYAGQIRGRQQVAKISLFDVRRVLGARSVLVVSVGGPR